MKKILLILPIIFLVSFLMAEVQLYHEPVASLTFGDPLILKLEVRNGYDEIKDVKLLYREQGELTYQEILQEMESISEPMFSFTVDAAAKYQTAVEYFFQVVSNDNNITTMPQYQASTAPYVVGISQPVVNDDSGFVLLSPDRDFSEITSDFVIAVSYFAVQDAIDLNSIQLMYDGKDVTSKTEIYNNMMIYKVKNSKGGSHMYKVSASLKNGTSIESETWKTNVSSSGIKQTLNLTGKSQINTYLSSQSYANDETLDNDDKRANWLLQLGGNYKWLGYKSKIYLSSLEDHNKQAVNRFNISLTSPYFDVTLGDYTPNYGSFLMSGKNIMGVHAKLHTKMFNLKVTSGKTKRMIEGSTTASRGSTFQQNSLGVRSEVGNSTFMWGFGFTKNKDDMESIDKDLYFTAFGDTLKPQDNLILGTDVALSLFKRRLMWGAEVALSYYNSNITDGAMSLEEIEEEFDTTIDLPFDPQDFENIFVANEFMQPFKPGLGNMAYKTYMRLFFYHNFLNISYSAVGGSFNSLSSNFLQKDVSTLSFNDNISMFGNKLYLNLGLNLINDNLNDEKNATTTSMNYNTSIYYKPTGLSFLRISYSSSNTERDGYVDPEDPILDILPIEITTANIGVGAGYLVKQIQVAPTQFSISFNNSNNEDVTNGTMDTATNNVSISANSDFEDLPLQTVVSYTLSMVDQIADESTYNALYLKGSLEFLDKTLKPHADIQFVTKGGDQDNVTTLLNVGSSYYLFKNTFFSTNIGTKLFANALDDTKDNSLLSWRFKFTQKF